MIKLNVKRKVGRSLIDVGIREVEDVEFARQLVEKGLAELVEGAIPEKPKKEKPQVKKTEPKKAPTKQKKG